MGRAFDLTTPPPMTLEYDGREYKLIPWFDNVLMMLRAIDGLDAVDRADVMCAFLVEGECPYDDAGFIAALMAAFFDAHEPDGMPRAMDFEQDAALIYAAFRQAYGIDLHAEIGRMHWLTFLALLEGLPGDTRFSDVVSIRVRPLPDPTKTNAKERAELMRLKQKYAVRVSEDERQSGLQSGLRKIAECLLALAEEGDENGESRQR